MTRVGVVDTTFARVDMGTVVEDTVDEYARGHDREVGLRRRTVPGIKDLPVAAKRLAEACEIVLALGQVGPEEIDRQCAHEASLGLQDAGLDTGTHVLEVFVHTDETPPGDGAGLRWLAEQRAREHALNAMWMLFEPERMAELAGTGQREGYDDEGSIQAPAEPPEGAP